MLMATNGGKFLKVQLRLVRSAPPDRLHHPGSFVRLNSGGPVGVVTSIDASDHLTISWLTDGRQVSILPDVCVSPAVERINPA